MATDGELLTIKKDGDIFVLQSRDIDVKQVFFGWASFGTGLRMRECPEYYGRDVDPRSPPPGTVLRGDAAQAWATTNADDYLWEWRLDDDSVEHLIELILRSLVNPEHYRMSPKEAEASKYVLEMLRTRGG